MNLFYHADLTEKSTVAFFGKEESQHIVKVLRKKQGDTLQITNGKGWFFDAEITFVSPKRCEITIVSATKMLKHDYYLHMVVAPTKMNDRYEWFLEKAVEIGVDEITPIICEHSERIVVKKERFEKIVLSAMKQSLQYHLPKLNDAIEINDFFKLNHDSFSKFIAHCEDDEKSQLAQHIRKSSKKIIILIGPEGDFSRNEIQTALHIGYQPISLGNTRLRTETAAIVACQTVAVIQNITTFKNRPL